MTMSKRSELLAEIAALRNQQHEETIHATYIGWTPGVLLEHERRAGLIALLIARAADSSGD
jgi:hypothetical protein